MRSFLSLPLVAAAAVTALSALVGTVEATAMKRGVSRSHKHEFFGLDKRNYSLPLQDPFYHRPHNLSSYKPGDVIRSRKIIPTMSGIEGQVGDTYQILYRTTNSENHPSSTVTTVIRPKSGGGPKMLSYHLWEDAVERDCAPSYTILEGNNSPNVMVVGDDVPVWFKFLLSNGISVVVPDYEGPKSALFAGFTAGYAILDSGRAVRQFFNWPDSAEFAMTGYSEGAHVTAWAANLQPSYASDLNVVGAAHGGTPVDMETTLKHFNGGPMSGFTIGGLYGMSVAYKKFGKALKEVAQPKVLNDLKTVTAPGNCHSVMRGPDYANVDYLSQLNLPNGTNFYNWGPAREVLDRESLWNNVSSVGVGYPTFPRMIYHGDHDDTISFPALQEYVRQQCTHPGVRIQFNVYEANYHTQPQLVLGGDANAMRFILSVFLLKGQSLDFLPCGFPTPSLLNIGTYLLDAILGGDIGRMLSDLWGQISDFNTIGFGNDNIHNKKN